MELGINLVGADYGLFPTQAEVDYFAAQGMTTIRLPLAWENLQPTQNGALDPEFLSQVKEFVAYANAHGMKVILDIHNYGSGYGHLIGTPETPISSFADLWGKLAGQFADNSDVIFGLMNEPQQDSAAVWLTAVNAAIDAIRKSGADSQEILVPGIGWDGAFSWTSNDNAKVIGTPGAVVDPSNNFAFEVHQYLDDTSGQNSWVVSASIGVERLQEITEWARANHSKLFLGEFGVADNPLALTALNNMLAFMQANSDVWQGGTYWAAGPSWHDYMYSIEPELGILDSAQMDVIENYTDTTVSTTVLANGNVQASTFVNGGTQARIIDIVDTAGHFVSRSIFDADGHIQRSLTANSDGTLRLEIYNTAGSENPSIIQDYSADHVLLRETTFNDDGTKTVEFFENGSHDSNRVETYGKDGNLTNVLVTSSDGSHIADDFINGHIATRTVYDPSWQLKERLSYDSSGKLLNRYSVDANGNNSIEQYDSTGARVVSQTLYSASWAVIAVTTYDAAGRISLVNRTLDGGLHEMTYYNPEGVQSRTELFDNSWKLLSRSVTNADGTHTTDTYATAGSSLVVKQEVFDSDWHLVTRTTYDANGNISSILRENADGTHTVSNYESGHKQPSTIDTFDASWHIVTHTQLDSTGRVQSVDHVKSDGTHVVETFDPATGAMTQSEAYDQNGHLSSRTTYDAAGNILNVLTEQADGTHVVANYEAGQTQPSTIETFDAAWHITSRTQLDSLGRTQSIDHVNSDGTHLVETFDPVSGGMTQSETYAQNWHLASRTTFDSEGNILNVLTEQADGSHVVANYETGHKQPSTIDTFDAAWHITSRTQLDSSGRTQSVDHVKSDGTHLVETFDPASGGMTQSETYDQNWHLASRTTFDSKGNILNVLTEQADGSHVVANYDTGHKQPSTIDTFDAAWHITSRTHLDSSGRTQSVDHVNSDGTHLVEIFDPVSGGMTQSETYDQNWHLASRTTFDSKGNILNVLTEQADGSHVVANYETGHKQPSTIDTFDSSWTIVSRAQLDSDGHVSAIDNIEADGSHRVESFHDGSVSLVETFDANWHLKSQVTYGDNDTIVTIRNENADGSHTIAHYLAGGSHPTSIESYDAAWHLQEVEYPPTVQTANSDTTNPSNSPANQAIDTDHAGTSPTTAYLTMPDALPPVSHPDDIPGLAQIDQLWMQLHHQVPSTHLMA